VKSFHQIGVPLLYLAILAGLPLLSILGHDQAALADPASELPTKLWCYEVYTRVGLLGGELSSIGFPNGGPLNNPDLVGTVMLRLLQPLLGRAGGYNAMVVLQLWLSMTAAWLLARDLTRDHRAALVAAVAFGLYPLVLVYCVAGAVTDMLNLWPYPLAILFGLRALRRGRAWDGVAAGACVGLGFISCPYNAVVFSAILVPALLGLPFLVRGGWTPERDPKAHGRLGAWPRALGGLLLGVLVTAGLYALWLRGMMADADSQMAASYVDATRHAPPFTTLQPLVEHRYTAFLSDYVAVGKGELISREAGSRYLRAFSVGFGVLALCAIGLLASWRRRAAVLFWLGVALFFVLASLGPFLPIHGQLSTTEPSNPVWLGLYYGFPGAKLLLEPFRYALGAALAFGLVAAVGARALQRRLGGWVGWLLPLLLVLEQALLSPVPVPLPAASLSVDPAYAELDEHMPPGALIELPYFDRGSERFSRWHFLNQLEHRRPILDEVIGFLPRYSVENHYLRALISAEKDRGQIRAEPPDPERIEPDRLRLADDGFVAIVVDPEAYASPAKLQRVEVLLAPLGEPLLLHGRMVYPLIEPRSSTPIEP
jgi:hypothetical protein